MLLVWRKEQGIRYRGGVRLSKCLASEVFCVLLVSCYTSFVAELNKLKLIEKKGKLGKRKLTVRSREGEIKSLRQKKKAKKNKVRVINNINIINRDWG